MQAGLLTHFYPLETSLFFPLNVALGEVTHIFCQESTVEGPSIHLEL